MNSIDTKKKVSSLKNKTKKALINTGTIQSRINRLTELTHGKQKEINKNKAYLQSIHLHEQLKSILIDDSRTHCSDYGLSGIYRVARIFTEKTVLNWSVCQLDYGVVIFADFNNITVCLFFSEDNNNAYHPAEFNYNKHPMAFNHIDYITKYYYQVYHEHYKSKRAKQIEREELKHREKLLAYLYKNEE